MLAPQKVICSNCGAVISVVSKHRPLSVSCHECGKKSVVTSLGHDIVGTKTQQQQQIQMSQAPHMGAMPMQGYGQPPMLPPGGQP